MSTTFSRNVRQRMLELNLDNDAAAKRCGVSSGTIHNICRQKPRSRPKASTIQAITEGLWGVPPSQTPRGENLINRIQTIPEEEHADKHDDGFTIITGGLSILIRRENGR